VRPQALLQLRQLLLLLLQWMAVLHPLWCLVSRATQILALLTRCLQENHHLQRRLLLLLLLLLDCLL
jgi:hypothetical protein